jgi:hypothetical protein
VIINPGSEPIDYGEGWTNTVEVARRIANEWLAQMRREGMDEIELMPGETERGDGRFRFRFRHTVTGVEAVLETHGINDLEAYMCRHTFEPRTYWRGSSSGTPCIEDFAAPGFIVRRTYIREIS